MSDELKEGDEFDLRLKIVGFYEDGYPIFAEKESGIHFFVGTACFNNMRKVRPGTYEVTARELVKMLAKLFRYKRLMAEIIAHEGRLNKLLQKRARRFFGARLKELCRKRR